MVMARRALGFGHSTRYHDPVWSLIKERFSDFDFLRHNHPHHHLQVFVSARCRESVKHGSRFDNLIDRRVFRLRTAGYVVGIALITCSGNSTGFRSAVCRRRLR